MNKNIRYIILSCTGLVMIMFSIWFIKSNTVAQVVNIIASLLYIEIFMKFFGRGSKKEIFWGYIGIAAFLVNILACLIGLSL